MTACDIPAAAGRAARATQREQFDQLVRHRKTRGLGGSADDGEEIIPVHRTQRLRGECGLVRFRLTERHPRARRIQRRCGIHAVHLVAGINPLHHALSRIRQLTQGGHPEIRAGLIDELAALRYGLSLIDECLPKPCPHRNDPHPFARRVRCLGQGTIGVIDDGYLVTRPTQRSRVTGTQHRHIRECLRGLGRDFCQAGAQGSGINIRILGEQRQAQRRVRCVQCA